MKLLILKFFLFSLIFLTYAKISDKVQNLDEVKDFKKNLDSEEFKSGYGKDSQVFESKFKFMVFFLYSGEEMYLTALKCSSSLIKPDWVLLAAHCFDGCLAPRNSSVILVGGRADLNDYLSKRYAINFDTDIEESKFGVQERRAKKIFVHQQYDSEEFINDIALVWTSKPFDIGLMVQTVPLSYDKMTSHSSCTILGWGDIENDKNTNVLMYADGAVARSVENGCSYRKKGNGICLVGGLGMGICPGDSGGPLICDGKVWGVASYSNISSKCGVVVEDFYTEVFPYLKWIERQMGEAKKSQLPPPLISDFALASVCIVLFFFIFSLTFFLCFIKMRWCCFSIENDEVIIHYSRLKPKENINAETFL